VSPRHSVLFVANGEGGSAAAERAQRFASATDARTRVLVRNGSRARSLTRMIKDARAFDPDLVYCVDMAAVPIAVASLSGSRSMLIVDTGDYPSAFLRHVGASAAKVCAADVMERFAYRQADAFVVRGRGHVDILRARGVRRTELIPDGVDLDVVRPCGDDELRNRLGLSRALTVGIAGHFTWYPRLGGGLGWELVHALALLRGLPIEGVLIGDGPGLGHLRLLAGELGVSERLHVLGRVPYDAYARYLSLIDVCLLTQTNDPASQIRTTGKLPGYLAAGRYVLASAVGTAVDVLPDEMLIQYEGRWDPTYPQKLAGRISEVVANPDLLSKGETLRSRAQDFAYPGVAARAADLIAEMLEKLAV
jgi:glycosyltransferase involved in cell wall biosynthesis